VLTAGRSAVRAPASDRPVRFPRTGHLSVLAEPTCPDLSGVPVRPRRCMFVRTCPADLSGGPVSDLSEDRFWPKSEHMRDALTMPRLDA